MNSQEGLSIRMTQQTPDTSDLPDWEREIRRLEEEARLAFLNADIATLTQLWHERFTVNSPLERINDRAQVLALLQAGRIRHDTYECDIEQISRYGDVVVVMGQDRVTGPPGGPARRRYTNVWQLQDGRWRSIARHAQLASREAGG
jgi:ketosteroid isomerase-like protein